MDTRAPEQGATCKLTSLKLQIFKMLPIHLLLQLTILGQALGSGVLELELVSLRLLDAAPKAPTGDPFRLAVCLKEAFASQLDGPCAYGNASITLDEHEPKIGTSKMLDRAKAWQENERELGARGGGEPVEIQSPQMTSVVRIPFSFRWTKSFTIVLTAERQTTKAADKPEQVTAERAANPEMPANRTQSEPHTSNGLALIDRHVLTENEVLPNWGANNKAAWTVRFSRSFKTSLVYRFRILCAPNYFGDDCATFCRPRDDHFGHLQCTPNGQRVCLEGWQGADCAQAKCSAGCNKQHGFCEQPDTCQCRPGWTGPRCDECLTYPGCQNGFCLAPWQCVCQPNWSGILCDQDLNYCGSHAPCENDGICQNAGAARYKCLCRPGFTGLNCQLKLTSLVDSDTMLSTRLHAAGCSQNPCLNGGLCLRVGQPPAITTIPPSKDLEQADLVEAQTSIQSATQPYRCQCPSGFTGDYCQWTELPARKENGSAIEPSGSRIDLKAAKNESKYQLEPDLTSGVNTSCDMNTLSSQLPFVSQSSDLILQARAPHHMEMRHLISGVVVASTIGVFCAALLLSWCCLLAIERGFASSLRRVQAKIRDSFRRSARTSIKPQTKLSLDNVLNPVRAAPPSYEQSNQEAEERVQAEFAAITKSSRQYAITELETSANESHLVRKGALDRELALKKNSAMKARSAHLLEHELAHCPKHGHLYKNNHAHLDVSTTIEIEYQPANTNS